jgi:hypothetical protein
MRRIIISALVACLPLNSALTAPPENADPALAPWFQSLKQPNTQQSCCSLADCRPVPYRITNKGFEVYIDDKTFTGGTNEWELVPEDKVLPPQPNPTGEGIVCWTQFMKVMCFIEASGA